VEPIFRFVENCLGVRFDALRVDLLSAMSREEPVDLLVSAESQKPCLASCRREAIRARSTRPPPEKNNFVGTSK
jgi:hypothetical protein